MPSFPRSYPALAEGRMPSFPGSLRMSRTAKLRWRCRRGKRELDLLLERYLNGRYRHADPAERAGFEALLERSDPDLEDLLNGRSLPECPDEARAIERIRGHD